MTVVWGFINQQNNDYKIGLWIAFVALKNPFRRLDFLKDLNHALFLGMFLTKWILQLRTVFC